MKNIGNFLVGTLSSLGVSMAIPEAVLGASGTSATIVNSLEALISLISGLLSAILVAWIKRKWDQNGTPST